MMKLKYKNRMTPPINKKIQINKYNKMYNNQINNSNK